MSDRIPEFELVLPCYNESRSLRRLVERAAEAAREANHSPATFRLVLVDNGSTDDSAKTLAELASTELAPWFRAVNVEVNQGYGHGIRSGLAATTAPFVGWSHADEQCDPRDAFVALRKLRQGGAEKLLVKGERSGRSRKEIFVSRVFEFCARIILGARIREINAQPKVFARALLGELTDPPKTFAFDLYALYRARKSGWRISTIPVLFPPRVHGVSRWASTLAGRYKTILGMIRYMAMLRARDGRL